MRVLANVRFMLAETEAAAQQRAAALDALTKLPPGTARFVGTAARFVEQLAEWHRQGACGGFNLLPAVLPDDVDMLDVATCPLAISHRRRTTFRERLGLARPRSQYHAEGAL